MISHPTTPAQGEVGEGTVPYCSERASEQSKPDNFSPSGFALVAVVLRFGVIQCTSADDDICSVLWMRSGDTSSSGSSSSVSSSRKSNSNSRIPHILVSNNMSK